MLAAYREGREIPVDPNRQPERPSWADRLMNFGGDGGGANNAGQVG